MIFVQRDWLHEHVERADLRIVDVRAREDYQAGCIPHAVHIDPRQLVTEINGIEGMVIPPQIFAQIVGGAGVDHHAEVVIYDDYWGMVAARVAWSFLYYGQARVAVLNGGWDAWADGGYPIVTPRKPKATTYTPRINPNVLAERDWILANAQRDDLVLLDTRSETEYSNGHLPHAVRWDWLNAVPTESWLAHRPLPELQIDLGQHGITPDKEVVVYCRSGARAAHTFAVLRQLGYENVRLYDGSWLDWEHALQKEV